MVRTCHIQYDFYQELSVEEQHQGITPESSFYINVDITPESIKEYRIQRQENNNNENKHVQYKVIDNDGDNLNGISQENQFRKVSERTYEATLDNERYQFQTPIEDLTNSINCLDIDWSTITRFPDGYILGDQKGSIHIYDSHWLSKKVFENAHKGEITSLQCFPSGSVLLSASNDMQIKLWSLLDGSNPRTFIGHTAAITDTVLLGRGRNFVSSGHDGTIRLWECGSGRNIHKLTRKEEPYDSINSIILFDSETQGNKEKDKQGLEDHELEFETEGKQIAAAHESGVITFHDLYTKHELLQLPNEFMSSCNIVVNNLDISSYYLCAGYENGTIAQWDIRSPNKSLSHIKLEGTLNPINTMTWSASSSSYSNNKSVLYISSGIDTSLRILLNTEGVLPTESVPQFLVSDDYRVSQYLILQDPENMRQGNNSVNEENRVVTIGNRGFISIY